MTHQIKNKNAGICTQNFVGIMTNNAFHRFQTLHFFFRVCYTQNTRNRVQIADCAATVNAFQSKSQERVRKITMAALAETRHSCWNPPFFDNALLHWLAEQKEQLTQTIQTLQQLPDRISYQFSPDKPRIEKFNVYRLKARWEELLKTDYSKEIALQKILALAAIDFKTYAAEYVLREPTSFFTLKIHSKNNHHIITDEYPIQPLLTMAQDAVKDFLKQGKPASRMEADSTVIAKMMDWAAKGSDGEIKVQISPDGPSYLGNNRYSFIFIRTLHVLPNGDREIQTTQHKVWLSHIDLLRLLVQSGIQIPQHTLATELSLTKLFLSVPDNFSEERLLQIANSLPQLHIPSEYKEVQLQNPDQFQKEYNTVEQFFLKIVENAFTHNQHRATIWRELEVALNFSERRLLKVVQDDKKNQIQLASLENLIILYEKLIQHNYHGIKLDKNAAADITQQLTGVLGSLNGYFSWGQCLGGSMFSLNLSGVTTATQYKGFPLELLAKQAGDKIHFENCPFCEKRMKVFDLPGKIVCSGCGNVKLCGIEHGESHGELTRTPDTTHTPPNQKDTRQQIKKAHSLQPQHDSPPISLSDFVAGWLL